MGELMTVTADALLDAALIHVPFDGWSDAALRAAARDCGVEWPVARALFPRGGVDLALAFHRRGDALMQARLATEGLSSLRYRDRVARAVRLRIEAAEDRELVRRGTTLFALPLYAADGVRAIWGTVDAIWTALGDTSRDGNWYTKRATLAGVYSATVLFWLGDDSEGSQATWEFLDRRIDNVMAVEKMKAAARENPLTRPFAQMQAAILERIKAPQCARDDLPGHVRPQPEQG
jgi:ubiquinone biosynthesis protein COQ9